jgi:thioredoxin-dependent peroxiredoxin
MENLQTYLKKHKQTIIYFYPKDNTPWCTIEAKDFSTHKEVFNKHGIGIVGISKDSEKSHCNFIEKQNLTIDLLSDSELVLHKKFWAWWEKNMYGKIVEWTIRSTFLVDQQGKTLKARKNVKATGHVEKLIKELELW